MKRRCVLRLIALPTLIASSVARAQGAPKTLHIGLLSSGDRDNRSALDEALVRGLNDRGFIEGRNLVIERRYSSEKFRENANELAGMKLDAVLTTCTPSTRVMKEATQSTPIVMVGVSDPVRQGLITSLAKPGGNVTGRSSQAEDLLAKRLELMAGLLPKLSTVAVLMNGGNPVHALGWQQLEEAATGFGLKLLKVELMRAEELDAAMAAAMRSKPAALFVMPDDPMMFNLRPRLMETASRYRLADFYWVAQYVESGGLMSYGESLSDSYYQTAAYLDAVARGALPRDMPVSQPTRFELVVNLKTARARGIAIPSTYLLRADRVIE